MTPTQAAIVTGGCSGIGLSTTKLLAKRGVSVVFVDIDGSKGNAIEKSLLDAGFKVKFAIGNVTDSASLEEMLRVAIDTFGRIDFAVNCAGITGPQVLGHEISEEDFHKIIAVDIEGTWRFSKLMITYWRGLEPRLVRHDQGEFFASVYQRGSLVNVASSLGSEGKSYLAVYCAAKHGVIGLSKTLALENAEVGIRVNTISPGLCMTPIFGVLDIERAQTTYLADQPMSRFAHPDKVAAGIVFTVMDGASFMTGSDWGRDGGHHVH